MVLGAPVFSGPAGADTSLFNTKGVDEVRAGDSFSFGLGDGSNDDGSSVYVVIDENGNSDYDDGEAYTAVNSQDGTTIDGTFPGSNTTGLNGDYTLYALETSTLSGGTDLSTGSTTTLSIDGAAPTLTAVTATNPSGQTLNVSFESSELLNETTLEIRDSGGSTVQTFDTAALSNESAGGNELYYTQSFSVSGDDTYTAVVTKATDSVGNDGASDQSDSVVVDTDAPAITSVEAEVGNNTVEVTFDETVNASDGTALTAANFTYTDGNSGGAAGVTSVSHLRGSDTATLTLDATVSRTDIGNDTVGAAPDEITDGFGNFVTNTGTLADTKQPAAPTTVSAADITRSNDGSYSVDVGLGDHEAGTVDVTLTGPGGGTVTASQYVDSGPVETVTFSGLDVSSLNEGTVTGAASLTDAGGNTATNANALSVEKDTVRPTVTDVSLTNATVNSGDDSNGYGTYDTGVEQTVTVTFDETVDTSVAPNVDITGLTSTYDVTQTSYSGNTWTGTFTLNDDNDNTTARVDISGATDAVGNAMTADNTNTVEVVTTRPARPEAVAGGSITASNATNYNVTVGLLADSEADEVVVRLSNGSTTVIARNGSFPTPAPDSVVVSGIDASSLPEGDVTVAAKTLDGGSANPGGFGEVQTTVHKDTGRPAVDSVSVEDAPIDDTETGTSKTVTVAFDQPVDTGVSPTVELTKLQQSPTTVSGSFDDATTWTGEVSIEDNEETTVADIEVTGVEDAVGNQQTPTTHTANFDVDTQTPAVSNFAATHTGGGDIEVSFDTNQTLATIAVSLDGTTLTETNFTETGSAGSYTYTATYAGAADGGYTAALTVAADDAGNDGAASQSDTVTVDTTPPVFGSGDPTGTVTTSQPEFTLDVSDTTRDVNASSIEVTVEDKDGVVLDAATTTDSGVSYSDSPTTLTVNTSDAGVSLADGPVTVNVSAADTVGNADDTELSFTVDTTPPAFSNPTPDGTATVTDDQTLVSVDVTDAIAGVDSSTLAVTISNGTDTVLSDATTSTAGVDFDGTTLTVDPTAGAPALPNGTVTVNVSATDTVGNTDTTEFSFTIDTPPVISGFSATDTATAARDATVSFDSTDDLTAVDVAVSGAETASLSLADFTKTAVTGGFEYTATYGGSTDGTYDFTLQTADDGVTDAASGQTATALVDEAAPAVTVDAPTGGNVFAGGETVTVQWTATDNVTVTDDVLVEYSTDNGNTWATAASGLANDGSDDWTVPTVDTTSALVRVTATDSSGNTGTNTSDATFEIDSTAPSVSGVSATNPSGQNVTVSFDSTEPLASIAVDVTNATTRTLDETDFTETGSGPYTYTETFNDSTDGFHDAAVTAAVDAAGNDGASSEQASVEVDTVTPTVSNVSVANPSGQTVNVSFDATERLDTTEVDLETPTTDTTLSTFTETGSSGLYTYSQTYDESADGQYNVTLTAADDGEGNDGATGQTATVAVDTTAPTLDNVSVTNPSGRQVRVEFDADEPIDAVTVDFSGPETASVSTDNPTKTADGSYVVTYTGNSDGDYTATLSRAVDADGNDAAVASQTVTVATTEPIISGFAASNPDSQNVTVTFGSDEVLKDISVSLSGPETATLTESAFTNTSGTYTATYVGSSNGTYTAVLGTAADANGDDGASGQTNSVTVGTAPSSPTGSFVSGFSATSGDGQSVQVTFDSSVALTDIGVAVTGPDAATLTTNDFTESGGTYTSTVAVDTDGGYTATLFAATDSSGDDGADGQSASATVDTTTDNPGEQPPDNVADTPVVDPGPLPVPDGPSVSVTTTGTASAAVAVEDADGDSAVSIPLGNATRGPVNVTGLQVTTADSTDYSLSVSSTTDAPPEAPAFDGRAVGHVSVTHSFDDRDVTDASLTVRVDRERFAAAAVSPDDASVYRYHDGDWQRLDTAVTERTPDAVVLEADTPGFSRFAVGLAGADAVRVSGASVTASTAPVGDAVRVSATVSNRADWPTNVSVTVTANGSAAATTTVAVPSAGTTTVAVPVSFDAPGDYRLAVGNTSAGTLAVRAPGENSGTTATPTTATTTEPVDATTSPTATDGDGTTADTPTPSGTSGGTTPGFGPLAALVGGALAALVVARSGRR